MVLMKAGFVAVALLASLAGCVEHPLMPGATTQAATMQAASPVGDARQLVLVVSDNWDATTAVLRRYSRLASNKPWQAVGEPVPVNVGRAGLGWGRGLHGSPPLPGPTKREGDGRSPAGAFSLPLAFGYAPKAQAERVKLPYMQLTAEVVGVDDVKSRYYNQIVRTDRVAKDWDSAETMLRPDGLYEWGVFVNHNVSPTQPGAGSCIFLHIWRGPEKPTSGCTSMSRENMILLAQWLDPSCRPVLVQLPAGTYRLVVKPWDLP